MMNIDGTEGKGWEISFDTDTDTDVEEEEGLDLEMDVPCRYSKTTYGPDGAEYK